jgi:uncharacterized repeat protein (TIGR03803 family)
MIVTLMAVCAAATAQGAGDSILHSFSGLSDEGITPIAPLVLDSSGYLYGTTQNSGAYSAGTVFKVRTNGTGFLVLHGFPSAFPEGYGPAAGLILDGAGTLYGTTQFGGTSNLGTIFKIGTDGNGFATVYNFSGGLSDGSTPLSSLVLDSSGYLYGTTQLGGASGSGVVFKVATNGLGFAILHSFDGVPTDGSVPVAGLVLDSNGWLYGTTPQGGTNDFGTVFKIKTNGLGYASFYSFTGGTADGGLPSAALILGPGSMLYGTTEQGGSSSSGTVFAIGTDGSNFATLANLGATFSDAANPMASLALDYSGTLFGTSTAGGDFGLGAVFKVRTGGGGYAVVHSFAGGTADGSLPYAAVIVDPGGNLYGTTTSGGAFGSGLGVVFAMDDAAAPIPIPALGSAGELGLAAGLAIVALAILRRRSARVW